jgi:mRNA-degrading endonuclease toxin of MazEF toxin-antitoxin module
MAPLTSDEIKDVADYEVFIKNTKETGLDKPSKVLLQRVRSIEKELRLINYLGEVDKETMKEVEKALKTVLDLED